MPFGEYVAPTGGSGAGIRAALRAPGQFKGAVERLEYYVGEVRAPETQEEVETVLRELPRTPAQAARVSRGRTIFGLGLLAAGAGVAGAIARSRRAPIAPLAPPGAEYTAPLPPGEQLTFVGAPAPMYTPAAYTAGASVSVPGVAVPSRIAGAARLAARSFVPSAAPSVVRRPGGGVSVAPAATTAGPSGWGRFWGWAGTYGPDLLQAFGIGGGALLGGAGIGGGALLAGGGYGVGQVLEGVGELQDSAPAPAPAPALSAPGPAAPTMEIPFVSPLYLLR